MSVHQILVPHFFLLFQCFNTIAEPNFLKQHSRLLITSIRWQSDMKFFIAFVSCCQFTKSVCHCCTTKISIQLLPLSDKFSNCVKQSLPERLQTILPDINIGLSNKKPCKLFTQLFCVLRLFKSTLKINFPWFILLASTFKNFFLTTYSWGPWCWTSARCTRDRRCPPCSGRRSGVGLMQRPPLQPSMEIPSRVGQVKTFVMGRDVFELGLSLKAQVFEL